MNKFQSAIGMAVFVAACGCASASASIDEVWECTLNEGKTMMEVEALNNAWVKFTNGKVKGGGVTSATVVPVVGEQGGFLFVDNFPTMQAWIETKALMETSEGKKVEAQILDTVTCTKNRLYKMNRQTGN